MVCLEGSVGEMDTLPILILEKYAVSMTEQLSRRELTNLLAKWRTNQVPLGIVHPSSDGEMLQMYFEGVFGGSKPHLIFQPSLVSAERLSFATSELVGAARLQMTMDSECAESVPPEHRDLVLSVAEGMVVFGFELQDGRIIAVTELDSGISPKDHDGVRFHFMRHMVGGRRIPVAVMPVAHC